MTMAISYPIGCLAIYSLVLWKHQHLLYPHEVRGRPTEDETIVQEAKRVNTPIIQPFALLHGACERAGVSLLIRVTLIPVLPIIRNTQRPSRRGFP